MNQALKRQITLAVANEPFARALNMELTALDTGRSVVEMDYRPELMSNIYHRAHGGALFALIDEAFETAAQTHGIISVALNVNVTYIRPPINGERLRATAREVAGTRKTATYEIRITGPGDDPIAICQAVAYRTGQPVNFEI